MVERGAKLDAFGAQDTLADLRHVVHQVVHLHASRGGVGAARQAEQAADDARGAVHLARYGRRRGGRFGVLAGAAEQLRLHANGRERVVHLVRHAARDLADGRELLARDQLALGAQLIGPVVQGHQQAVRSDARQAGDRAVADTPVAGRLRHEHPTVPRVAVAGPGEDQVQRHFAGRQAECLEVGPERLPFEGDPKQPARRLVQLLHAAAPIHQCHRQGAPIYHGMRSLGGGAGAADGLRQLESPRDVGRHRGEILELEQGEGGWLLRAGPHVAHDADGSSDPARCA